ncbi:Gldg family protein [Coraliomargarita sp. SDUM461003]|uniref:Gldg family protein n=1 Tax=Thalassobacterium maritimum TaxID=3041265 RepID=A0ABU1AZ30_9BACT|nr:Gldg family protein [Coraliomargarita sp. SDUM461003]MDQ8209414.1 Gldg family protein [Coraliomargarita sp. SDUM461003]
MNRFRHIFRKEFNSFFASPAAWLFMGAFLVVTLFIFFWGEAFFARNIADVKPLFQWMPVLLIFLVGTLSMRTWSEERRAGTIETLLTSPVGSFQLVLGKFAANLALVGLALVLTLPLPFSVALAGPLDWGPVIGGYVASIFLAAAYVAIGLYMSSRTDNPIVALILTVFTAGVFYLVGSSMLTTLFSHRVSGVLELIGSGSRFDSITRGVLDLRDIYYYLSILGVFLALNLFSLERLRWAGNPTQSRHVQWVTVCALAVVNLLAANVWLHSVRFARIDLTEGNAYSLSEATGAYLQQAAEPLLIRGYFSQKSHPLLEPLVPQLKDLLEEYQVAGGEKVRVEFVDPHSDQSVEEEAADKYGIRPVPFRMASRYEAGVVNSYFDLVVAYGDQHETLSFDDLIEVKSSGSGEPEVLLKNPEYEITRAVRKVINGYRAGSDVFAELPAPVEFKAYVSPADRLPSALAELRASLENTLESLAESSGGKLSYDFADPDANNGQLGQELNREYGFVPQVAGLFDMQPFWFYMVLEGSDESVQVPLPSELSETQLRQSIESAIQRLSPGYLKTIGLVAPEGPANNAMNPYMMQPPAAKEFNELRSTLEANARVIDVELDAGQVPVDVDLLMVLAPDNLGEKAIFAIDQFLMQGGSVVIATSPFDVSITRSINANEQRSGLDEWLGSMGITVGDSLVLDTQNASLAIPVPRRVGPVTVNEIVMMPYPHFPDIRSEGLDDGHPVTAALGQLTMNWASPITVDSEKSAGREVARLVRSSTDSWTSEEADVMPDYQMYPLTGFVPGLARSPQTLAVATQGHFDSYFKDKESPLLPEEEAAEAESEDADAEDNAVAAEATEEPEDLVVGSVIQRSSDSARLVVIGSNSFAEDSALSLTSQALGTEYTAPLEFMQNVVDWSLDDAGLLTIRGRTQLARTLEPMSEEEMRVMELSNYGLAISGLGLVWLIRHLCRRKRTAHYKQILAEV